MGRVTVMRRLAALAAAGCVAGWAAPSMAEIVALTVQGTAVPVGSYAPFSASFPQFGAGQQPAAYTLQYTYDTALGASGGTSVGSPSPITGAQLTILDGSYLFGNFTLATIGPEAGGVRLYGAIPVGGAYIQTDIVGGFPSGLGQPFALSCAQTCGSGVFQLPFGNGRLNLSVTEVSSRIVPAPAPEPGVWATLIAGLAMLGAALRRRRRVSAVVCPA